MISADYWLPGASSPVSLYSNNAITSGFIGNFFLDSSPTTGETYVDFHMTLDPINFPGMADSIVSFRVDAVIQANYKDSTKKRMDFSFTTAGSSSTRSTSSSSEELQAALDELIANTPTKAGQAASKTKFSINKAGSDEDEAKGVKPASSRPEKPQQQQHPKQQPQNKLKPIKEKEELASSAASSASISATVLLVFFLAVSLIF